MIDLATKILEGSDAQQLFEWQFIPKLFGFGEDEQPWKHCSVSCDTYDWSLEIYLYNVDHKTFTITPGQIKAIMDQGCTRFWINFQDTEECTAHPDRAAELYCFLSQNEYKCTKREFK